VGSLEVVIQIVLMVIVVLIPIITSIWCDDFIGVNLISLPLMFLCLVLWAYWPHLYADLRLYQIGFNFDGMNDAQRALNVSVELKDEATKLYWSNMGIGWPLKAIIGAIILTPYPSIVFGGKSLFMFIKKNRYLARTL